MERFTPDSQYTMELWAFRPHVNWVKVICVCVLHVFFHQYVVDIREGRLENIFRTVSTSIREQDPEIGRSHITDMTDSFHGQIRLEKLDTFAAGCQGTVGCQASHHICDDDVHSGEPEDIPG